MSTLLPLLDCRPVLQRFLPGISIQPTALSNRGGFSGAELWRVQGDFAPLCLKAWPVRGSDPEHLERIHALMLRARQAGLPFVPDVRTCAAGATWVKSAGRFWDLTTWMPGQASFHLQPTPIRLAGATGALARLHNAWQGESGSSGPCPSVARRLDALTDWSRLKADGWRLAADEVPVLAWRPLLIEAWNLAVAHEPGLRNMLQAWAARPVALQPCIGDVWHDHILFERDSVTGIIDYGEVRIDHPGADLGRLVGSMVADDETGWATALAGYRGVRPFSWEEDSLARLLDRSGIIVSLFNWLRWCGRGERTFAEPVSVTNHLAALVKRVEQWSRSNLISGIENADSRCFPS